MTAMKVLIVYKDIASIYDNPFVATLKDALSSNGIAVDWGLEKFWNSTEFYDCILFQWPGTIYDYAKVTRDMAEAVKGRIGYWRSRGAMIAYTRHNSCPHLSMNDSLPYLYTIVESNADIVFHMGKYSEGESIRRSLSPSAKHYVVPHQIYENIDRGIIKDSARELLGIAPQSKVILCFGEFRNDAERDMVINAYKWLDIRGKYLLTPRFFRQRLPRRNPFTLAKRLMERIPYLFTGRIFQDKTIPREKIPYFFSAADIVLIQRKKILNSGNLPMAFYFGKVVVGPDVGNVGEILRATGNPVFNPESVESVRDAVEQGLHLSTTDLGKRNQVYAERNWSQHEVGRLIVGAINDCKS